MKKTGKIPRFPIHAASRSKRSATVRRRSEETLFEKENFVRNIIELSSVIIVVYDLLTEHYTYFSNDALKFYGYTADEMMRMQEPFDVLIHPEDIPKVRENINSLKRLGDGEINEFECRIRRGDGVQSWINTSSMIFARDEKGEAIQVISATFDITERKEAEEKLIESEKRFRSYFELGLIGMAITSPTKGCLAVNDEFCKILGYERDDLLKRNWTEMTHPEDIAADVANFDRVMIGEIDDYRLDKRWIRKGGQIIDTTISVKCARCADGSVDYFVALVEDVTARRQLENERQKFVSLAENSSEFIGICDLNFAPIYINDAGVKMVGLESLEQARLLLVQDFFFEEDRELVVGEFFSRVLRDGAGELEVRMRHFKTGEPLWMIFTVFVITNTDGEMTGLGTASRNITERRQAEEAVRQANDELEHRVLKRTRQLSDLNENLIKEIAERERVEADRERLLSRIVSAQEDERQRIAREMHDQLGQNLSVLALELSALKNDYVAQPELREHFASLKKIVEQLDVDVGLLVRDLRPTALDDFGLDVALSNYVQNWSKQFGVRAELHTSGMEKDRLTGEIEIVLYRITQEALTNVAKHANAENVDILLERRSDHVSLIIEDDGDGFDVERAFGASEKGFGLIGMRERAALVDGTLAVESHPGTGATVAVRIPASRVVHGDNQNE